MNDRQSIVPGVDATVFAAALAAVLQLDKGSSADDRRHAMVGAIGGGMLDEGLLPVLVATLDARIEALWNMHACPKFKALLMAHANDTLSLAITVASELPVLRVEDNRFEFDGPSFNDELLGRMDAVTV